MIDSLGKVDPSVEESVIICDGCDHEVRGYFIGELMVMGWRWVPCHPIPSAALKRRWLALCPDCDPTPKYDA
jgi:hypothetical protein